LESICEYLALKRYVFWRQNNAPIFDTTRKAFRAMPKYSAPGLSDILLLKRGRVYFLEVKSAKGKISPQQEEFKAKVEAEGCEYFVVRSIDDVLKAGF